VELAVVYRQLGNFTPFLGGCASQIMCYIYTNSLSLLSILLHKGDGIDIAMM